MFNVSTRNVNSAYNRLMPLLKAYGRPAETRNGVALALPAPAFIEFRMPCERVLFDANRNCNPFFHLVESLWMIAGRNDTAFVSQFNQNMMTYSDNGLTFNAAYGHRWRQHFGYDQIKSTCEALSKNPLDRRCVLAMWDGYNDLSGESKDYPCNTSIMCRVVDGALDFTITNRSNDLVFGLCGANAVHMSVLHEYMAARIGVPVGKWYHLANNLHIYERHFHLLDLEYSGIHEWCQYPQRQPLVKDWAAFDQDCTDLCNGKVDYFTEPFFDGTVAPMVQSWHAYKRGAFSEADHLASCIEAEDWYKATTEWLARTEEKRHAKD
jgi:hypothetical protein